MKSLRLVRGIKERWFLPSQQRQRQRWYLLSSSTYGTFSSNNDNSYKPKGNAGIVFTNNNSNKNGLVDIDNQELENQDLIQNMGKLHIDSVDKQLSPSALDISAYLADKKWNRPEGSYIEKEDLLELLSLSETHSVEEIVDKYSKNNKEKVAIKEEEIKMLLNCYAMPTIEKAEEKMF
mmetsp:Transcript_8704/g.10988  ORF Transcript_8704/g.10988 Transcript_8704/m.10988 type:complete len:178 (+) Transcript_8704:133-666(+)